MAAKRNSIQEMLADELVPGADFAAPPPHSSRTADLRHGSAADDAIAMAAIAAAHQQQQQQHSIDAAADANALMLQRRRSSIVRSVLNSDASLPFDPRRFSVSSVRRARVNRAVVVCANAKKKKCFFFRFSHLFFPGLS